MSNNSNAWLVYKNASNSALEKMNTTKLQKLVNNSIMSSNRTGLANWQLKVQKIIAKRKAHPIRTAMGVTAKQAAKLVGSIYGGLHIGYEPGSVKISSVTSAKRRNSQNKLKKNINNVFKREFIVKKYKVPQRYLNFVKNWNSAANNLNKRNKVIAGFNRSYEALYSNLPFSEKLKALNTVAALFAISGALRK